MTNWAIFETIEIEFMTIWAILNTKKSKKIGRMTIFANLHKNIGQNETTDLFFHFANCR